MPTYGTTPSERALMARSLAALFASGATLVLLTLLLPHGDRLEPLGIVIPALIAYAVAIVLLLLRDRLPAATLGLILAAGTGLITVCVRYGGDAATAYPAMYLWVVLFAYSFFALRMAAIQLFLVATFYGLAAGFGDTRLAEVHWLMVLGTLGVGGLLVGLLTAAVRAQAQDLATVAAMASGLSDLSEFAQATVDGLMRSSGADVVILLEGLPEGGGMQVTAMAGVPEAGMVFTAASAREALERCFVSGTAQVILADRPSRLRGTVAGYAHPVLRGGQTAGVLALGHTTPRRALSERAQTAALLFASEASVAMDRVEAERVARERQALEINDNIVQGLVLAKYTAQRGDLETAVTMIDETLGRARALISEQLTWVGEHTGAGVQPGDLARSEASSVGQPGEPA